MRKISSRDVTLVVFAMSVLTLLGVALTFNSDKSQAKIVDETTKQGSKINNLPGNTQAMWIFADNQITDTASRARLVDHSAQSGVTDLYASVYQSAENSSGRRMFDDAIVADLNSRAHMRNQKVWAAYGSPEFPTFPCTPTAFPVRRMAEVAAYNNSRIASERFDGVVLDVEPPEPMSEADFQALLAHYKCMRDSLPPEIKLAAAIRFFWTTPVTYPAVGGSVKPAYQHILDLNLDNVIIMGYRDFAGTDDCAQGDGIICLDQDEVNYATSINKPGQVLVGLETLDPSAAGLLDKETFFEEGQIRLNWVSQQVRNHFSNRSGFGGFAIHNYKSAYLSELQGWESPATATSVFYSDFSSNTAAAYTTGGEI
ncbi:MAG TPA: hypothetical protein VK308_13390, partial [Pyrinomonadaceae bacterium]|nr:hypothetical protein [Pyrinomonadaceae bacterium]